MKSLVRIRPTGGIITDIPASEVGENFYTEGRNIRFPDGLPERANGATPVYGPALAPPLQVIVAQNGVVTIPEGTLFPAPDPQAFPGAQDVWVYVSEIGQYAVNIEGHTNLTMPGLNTQSLVEQHSLCNLNGIVAHNNAIDPPMYWTGDLAEPFAPLAGWPTNQVARVLRSHLFHLFALDLVDAAGEYPLRVAWSDAAEPGGPPSTWVPSATSQAGFVDLADTPGALMTAHTLRDTLLIYKRDAIYACDYVGGTQIFSFRSLFRGVGALTPRAVAITPEGHIFVTDADVMMTDGNTVRSIAAGKVRRIIAEALNQRDAPQLFAFYNPMRRETVISIPGDGGIRATFLSWSHDSQAWGTFEGDNLTSASIGVVASQLYPVSWNEEVVATWQTDQQLWNTSPYSYTNSILATNPGSSTLVVVDDPDAYVGSAYIEKGDMSFGEPERLKFVRRLHIRRRRGAPVSNMYARVGTRMTLDDPIKWGPDIPLINRQQVANVRALGRYISVRISSGATTAWALSGFDLEVEMRGYQ